MWGEAYKRWRHSRGYGVHSPFAYRIVKEVINPERGYGWYGYKPLSDKYRGKVSDGTIRRSLMLLRLASFLDIGSAYIADFSDRKIIEYALKQVNSKIGLTSDAQLADNARLIITDGKSLGLEKLSKLLERPGRAVYIRDIPSKWTEKLFENLDEGLMLHSRRNALLISRPGMMKVSYTLRKL